MGITHPDSAIVMVSRSFPRTYQTTGNKSAFCTTSVSLVVLGVSYPGADLKVVYADDAKKRDTSEFNFDYKLIPGNVMFISVVGKDVPYDFPSGSILFMEGIHVKVSLVKKYGTIGASVAAQAVEYAEGISSPDALFYAMEEPLYPPSIFEEEVDMRDQAAMLEFGDYGKQMFHLPRIPTLDAGTPPEILKRAEEKYLGVPNGDYVKMSEHLDGEGVYKIMGGKDDEKRVFQTTLDVLSWRGDDPDGNLKNCDDWTRYMLSIVLYDEDISKTFKIYSISYWKRLWYVVREMRFDILFDVSYKNSKLMQFWKEPVADYDGSLQIGSKVFLADLPLFIAEIGIPVSFETAKAALEKQNINNLDNPLHPKMKDMRDIPLTHNSVILAQEATLNLEMFKHIGSHFVAVPLINIPRDMTYLQRYRSLSPEVRKKLIDSGFMERFFESLSGVSLKNRVSAIEDFLQEELGDAYTEDSLEMFNTLRKDSMPEYAIFIVSSVQSRLKSFIDDRRCSAIQTYYGMLSRDPVAAFNNRIASFKKQAAIFGVDLYIPDISMTGLNKVLRVDVSHPEHSSFAINGNLKQVGASDATTTTTRSPLPTNAPESKYASMDSAERIEAERKMREETEQMERELLSQLPGNTPPSATASTAHEKTTKKRPRKRSRVEKKAEEEDEEEEADPLQMSVPLENHDDDDDLGMGLDPNPRKTKRVRR